MADGIALLDDANLGRKGANRPDIQAEDEGPVLLLLEGEPVPLHAAGLNGTLRRRMPHAKPIGITAGSAEGAVLCYRTICAARVVAGAARIGQSRRRAASARLRFVSTSARWCRR